MAYDQTVPKTGSNGSSDYVAMQGNYAQIQTSFSADHEPLGSSGALEGFHKKSSYVSSGADPAAAASLGIVYTKTPASHTELYYEGELTTGKVLQITNQSLTQSSGEGMLPGGLQIRSGLSSILGGASTSTVSFTAFGTSIAAIVTPENSATLMWVTSLGVNSFVVNRSGTAGVAQFYWIAIGY